MITDTSLKPQHTTNNHRSSDALGNDANISSAGDNASKKHLQSSNRYKLLDHARTLLRSHNIQNSKQTKPHRTRFCSAVRSFGSDHITITLNNDANNSKAGLSGVQTCGSLCSCPVCHHRKMIEYGYQIRQAFEYAKQNKLVPVMITLTAAHHANMSLAWFRDKFKDAWRKFSSGRPYRRLKEQYGITHWIAAREITRKALRDNGWHYHMHIVLFLDGSLVMENEDFQTLKSDLSDHWTSKLDAVGLDYQPEYAFDLSAGHDVGKHYLTKLGISSKDGDLSYEMTGSENKGHTIWDILRHSMYGDQQATSWYLEYVEAMTGENWITSSHGLWKLVEDIELETNEAASDDMTDWMWIDDDVWRIVVINNQVSTLLDIAARSRDRSIVWQFLELLKQQTGAKYEKF